MLNLQGVFIRQKHPDGQMVLTLTTSLEAGTASELNPSSHPPPALSWGPHHYFCVFPPSSATSARHLVLSTQPDSCEDRSFRISLSAGLSDELFIIKVAVTNVPPR